MDDFAGRVAVVTGAASGIGRGLARHAAKERMRVVLADVEAPALDDAVAEVRALGADAVGIRTDVSRADEVQALADQTFERFGATHLLCNNAGVFQAGVVWQRTQADWDWVMGVNVWGILHAIRAFVPRMLEQGTDAHIVNTASMAGLISVAYSGPYVVSKFAAAALTECLAHDLRANESTIGVSCLVPGLVDTRIADSTRNRPDEPPSEVTAPDHHFVAEVLKQQTSTGGRPPDEVAEIVFDAVRARQFWIPTTDGFEPLVRGRYDALLNRSMPPTAEFD
jgi:NAD(P)-dependent dehydrogenase (short-subunit alcohol dehydrogenase family)